MVLHFSKPNRNQKKKKKINPRMCNQCIFMSVMRQPFKIINIHRLSDNQAGCLWQLSHAHEAQLDSLCPHTSLHTHKLRQAHQVRDPITVTGSNLVQFQPAWAHRQSPSMGLHSHNTGIKNVRTAEGRWKKWEKNVRFMNVNRVCLRCAILQSWRVLAGRNY